MHLCEILPLITFQFRKCTNKWFGPPHPHPFYFSLGISKPYLDECQEVGVEAVGEERFWELSQVELEDVGDDVGVVLRQVHVLLVYLKTLTQLLHSRLHTR